MLSRKFLPNTRHLEGAWCFFLPMPGVFHRPEPYGSCFPSLSCYLCGLKTGPYPYCRQSCWPLPWKYTKNHNYHATATRFCKLKCHGNLHTFHRYSVLFPFEPKNINHILPRNLQRRRRDMFVANCAKKQHQNAVGVTCKK